jgi:hypothetical protein
MARAERQYEGGELLFRLSPAIENDVFFIEGPGQYDPYDEPEYLGRALDRLASLHERH